MKVLKCECRFILEDEEDEREGGDVQTKENKWNGTQQRNKREKEMRKEEHNDLDEKPGRK